MSNSEDNGIEMKSLEDELRKAFELFDEDRDGEITLDELARIMESHGFRPSQEELERMIGSADTNRQERLTINTDDRLWSSNSFCIQDDRFSIMEEGIKWLIIV